MAKRLSFSDQIRRAIRESGLTQYRIAKDARIHQALMSRFVNGRGGISLASLDRVAALIGLEVKAPQKK